MTDPDPDPDSDPGPVRVRVHPALCEGWGECHRWAGHIYPLDDEGQVDVHLLEVPGEHAEDAWLGATVCPKHAITLIGPPDEYWIARRRRRSEQRDHPAAP